MVQRAYSLNFITGKTIKGEGEKKGRVARDGDD